MIIADEPRTIINPFKENTRQNGRRIKEPNEPMFCITVTDRHGITHKENQEANAYRKLEAARAY